MESLSARYEQAVQALCDALSSGRVPWNEPVALQGPPMLGRAGTALRGLAALLAWQAGGRLPGMPLAWRLVAKPDALPEGPPAVLKLPANGGEALYGAVPDARPKRLVDRRLPSWRLSASELVGRLEELLALHSGDTAAIRSDAGTICSLAAALMRPYQPNNQAEALTPEGAWDHARLARVAAWAQLLVDSADLQPKNSAYWRIRRKRQAWKFYRAGRADRPVSAWLERLCHSGLIQGCLPAELRALERGEGAPLSPELPVREAVFHSLYVRRTPGVGFLAAQIPSRELGTGGGLEAITSTLSAARWRASAVQALALCERLSPDPLPSEPGQAWRIVGRTLRDDLRRGGVKGGLWSWEGAEPAMTHACWRGLVRRHRALGWLHPTARSRLEDLRYKDRFLLEDLQDLAETTDDEAWEARGRKLQVSRFPAARVAGLRRVKAMIARDEAPIRTQIAGALQCAPGWAEILTAAAASPWERQARTKRSGGLRWLDIPAPPLRAAQRIVGGLLQRVMPLQSWLTAFHAGASPALHARAHAGAVVAVHSDLRDYFGSLHPWHLEPWLGLGRPDAVNLLPGWSEEGRRALVRLVFHQRGGLPYLPQGAPSSPVVANLGGMWLDHAILAAATAQLGPGRFTYTRYADDLVISTRDADQADGFGELALRLLTAVTEAQGFSVLPDKTWAWRHGHGQPLVLGGLRVPSERSGALQLERETLRRARAALHRLRHRLDYTQDRVRFFARKRGPTERSPDAAHGLLAHAYAATGDPRWLAYTSGRLARFARLLAGPLFSESLLAGWSDEARVD